VVFVRVGQRLWRLGRPGNKTEHRGFAEPSRVQGRNYVYRSDFICGPDGGPPPTTVRGGSASLWMLRRFLCRRLIRFDPGSRDVRFVFPRILGRRGTGGGTFKGMAARPCAETGTAGGQPREGQRTAVDSGSTVLNRLGCGETSTGGSYVAGAIGRYAIGKNN